jgi:sialidase-1
MVCTNSSAKAPGGPCPSCVACLIVSDDGGKTWVLGGIGPPGTRESEIVQIPSTTGDAAFYLNGRNMGPTPGHRMTAACSHGGEVCGNYKIDLMLTSPITPHWTGIVAAVTGVANGTGGVTVVYTGPGSTTARANMTMRVSTTDGATWGQATTIWPGPAAYSDLAAMGSSGRSAAGATVAVIFENGVTTFADRVSVQLLSITK